MAANKTKPTDACAAGFSPRKRALTVHLADGFDGREELLGRLGPHTTGKACLYLKRLDAVDRDVLRALVESWYRYAVTVVDAPERGALSNAPASAAPVGRIGDRTAGPGRGWSCRMVRASP
jgi:hypothetical protein